MGLRICSSKEDAIQAAEAGLLWINMGTHTAQSWVPRRGLDVAYHYGKYYWKPEDFAVLVEDESDGQSSACD